MKFSINILAISFIWLCSTALANENGTDKTLLQVKSKYDNVKVYQQASTASNILAILEENQRIGYFRHSNMNGGGWSIVNVDGVYGYVLTTEIYNDQPFYAKKIKRKNKKEKSELFSKARQYRKG